MTRSGSVGRGIELVRIAQIPKCRVFVSLIQFGGHCPDLWHNLMNPRAVCFNKANHAVAVYAVSYVKSVKPLCDK